MCVSFNSTGFSQHPRYIWGRKWLDKEAKSPSSPCGYHVPQVGAPLCSGLKGRILTRNHGFCSEILGGSCSLSHHSILVKIWWCQFKKNVSKRYIPHRHVLRLWKAVSHVATRQTKIPGQMLIPHHIEPSPSMFFGSKSHSLYTF